MLIKQIHTFTSNILFEQRRFGLGCPSLYQVKCPFDLIKAGATQTELFADERVDLLDNYDFPARTTTEADAAKFHWGEHQRAPCAKAGGKSSPWKGERGERKGEREGEKSRLQFGHREVLRIPGAAHVQPVRFPTKSWRVQARPSPCYFSLLFLFLVFFFSSFVFFYIFLCLSVFHGFFLLFFFLPFFILFFLFFSISIYLPLSVSGFVQYFALFFS